MSKPKGHNADDYTLHPGRRFGLEWAEDEGDCQIFFLSERAATMLRKLVQVFPKYYWVWGIDGPQRDWSQSQWDEWDAILDFVSETEAALVSGCDAKGMMNALNRLTAAIAGETITIDVDGVPTEFDYTETGISPVLQRALFTAPSGTPLGLNDVLWALSDYVQNGFNGVNTDLTKLIAALVGEVDDVEAPLTPAFDYSENGIVPTLRRIGIAPVSWQDDLGSILTGEASLAQIAKDGLIGRRLDLTPLPFEGKGLADITDDQLQTLHERLVMHDSSIFNITGGEKNLVEALEHNLRVSAASDIELLPNVADVLQQTLKLADDTTLNAIWDWLANRFPVLLKLPWVHNIPEKNTITQILAAMLTLMSTDTNALGAIAKAIEESQTQINITNTNHCAGTNSNGKAVLNGNGNNGTITLTDEGINVQIEQPEANPLLGDGS